jgi:hypothetical protein
VPPQVERCLELLCQAELKISWAEQEQRLAQLVVGAAVVLHRGSPVIPDAPAGTAGTILECGTYKHRVKFPTKTVWIVPVELRPA